MGKLKEFFVFLLTLSYSLLTRHRMSVKHLQIEKKEKKKKVKNKTKIKKKKKIFSYNNQSFYLFVCLYVQKFTRSFDCLFD